MMKFKRIISLALVLAICMSSAVFAATIDEVLENDFKTQVDYAADIYKYDMNLIGGKVEEEIIEEEIPVEVLKHERADKIMSALGLMSFRSDGFFYEDEILKVTEFCAIVDAILGLSDDYQTKTNITHKDVLDVIVKALGYEYMNEKSIMEKVYRENILKGVSYNPEKFVTRGEASRLFYNALSTPVMLIDSVGKNVTYTSSENMTLLTYTFGLEEIEGLVTAANGIGIYSNKEYDNNYIEINRGSFFLDESVDTTSLFGKKVFGLLDLNDEEKIVFLAENPEKQSILVQFEEIDKDGDTLSWKINGVKGKANISSIKNISYNGTAYVDNAKLSEIESGEGTVLFASSNGNIYDIAIIDDYETFVVDRASVRDEKLYFADGREFHGEPYIDLNEEINPNLCVTLNGQTANPCEFKQGTILSVVSNYNGYYKIEASDKFVKGTITEITDTEAGKAYFVKNQYYLASPAYQEASKPASLPALNIGVSNIFMLNALGHISYAGEVAAVAGSAGTVQASYKYAYLKAMAFEEGLSESAAIRVFTQDGTWNNYTIAKKVVIDGVEKNSFNDIKSTLSSIRSQIEGTLIRYKLNAKKEISFIDTKTPTPEEANDTEAISLTDDAIDLSVKIEWNKGLTFLQQKYGILDNTVIFYEPADKDEEKDYRIMKRKDLPSGSNATFTFYNVDDFYYAGLALYQGKLKASWPANNRYFVITNILNSINDKGEDVITLQGLDSVSTGEDWVYREYETSTKTFTRTDRRTKGEPDIAYTPKIGDFVQCSIDGNGKVNGLNALAVVDEMIVDGLDYYMHYYYNYPSQNDYVIGEVRKVDTKRDVVLFRTFSSNLTAAPTTVVEIDKNTDEYSAVVDRVIIFDSKTKTAEIASTSDLNIGDRIAMFGGWGQVGAVVYR